MYLDIQYSESATLLSIYELSLVVSGFRPVLLRRTWRFRFKVDKFKVDKFK